MVNEGPFGVSFGWIDNSATGGILVCLLSPVAAVTLDVASEIRSSFFAYRCVRPHGRGFRSDGPPVRASGGTGRTEMRCRDRRDG